MSFYRVNTKYLVSDREWKVKEDATQSRSRNRDAITAFTWLEIPYETQIILPAIHGLSWLTEK